MAKWLLAVMLVTIGIYASVASMPFVYEDANWTSELHAEEGPMALWSIPGRSLTMRTLVWNWQLDGLNPAGFHAVNLALHLVVGLLVWRVAGLVTGDARAALFAALVMLWHPLNSQAVSYISARGDLLMASCVLSAVIGLLACRWLVPLAVLGALVSKETGVAVVVILAWTWMVCRGWSRNLSAAVAGAICGVALASERLWFALNVSDWRSMLDHISIQATGFWRALSLFVLPVGLSIDPDPWSVPATLRYAAVVGVIGLTWVAWAARHRAPAVAFGLGVAVLSVSPRFLAVSQGEPLHEHHTYLAVTGLSVLAGWGFSQLLSGEQVYA